MARVLSLAGVLAGLIPLSREDLAAVDREQWDPTNVCERSGMKVRPQATNAVQKPLVALFTKENSRTGEFDEFEEEVWSEAEAQAIARRNHWDMVWVGERE